MPKKLTELDVLRGAYAFLDSPKKWMKSSFVRRRDDGTLCACLDGALILSAGGVPCKRTSGFITRSFNQVMKLSAYRMARGAVSRMLPTDDGIFNFNDDPATRLADIRAVLRKAIKAAEKAAP